MYKVHVYPYLSPWEYFMYILIYHHGSIIIMVLFTMFCNYLNKVITKHDRGVYKTNTLPTSLTIKKVFNLHIIILVM